MNQYIRILFCSWLSLFFFNASCLNAQEHPKYYYVATDGNDSNPGTESLPLKTLAKAASVATAGVIVFIRQGIYNERLIPVNSGTPEEPIVFASYPGDDVTITGNGISFPAGQNNDRWWNGLIHIQGLSHIKITGLKVINSAATGILVRQSSDITVERNLTDDTFSPGISINECENIVVEGNEVVHACSGGDQECISFTMTNLFEIKNNSVHDGFTEGIDVKVGCSNGTVFRNEVYNQKYRFGIYIEANFMDEFNIDVFENIIHDNSTGLGVATENTGVIQKIKIHHNVLNNNDISGIWVAGGGFSPLHRYKNIEFYCNSIYQNSMGINITAFSGTDIDSLKISNNLIFLNSSVGITTNFEPPAGQYVMKNIEILNNIIYKNGTSTNGWGDGGINITGFVPEKMLIRNNILSNNAAFTICVQTEVPSDSVTIDYNFFDGFHNFFNEKTGTNAVYGSPLFSNTLSNDYHLQAASAAIDNGNPGQIYNDPEDHSKPGYALYPAQGNLRNDMGAYGGPFASSWDPDSYASIPSAPGLVFPPNGEGGVPATLLLGWNGPRGASSYRLQVSTSSDFSTIVTDSSGIKGSTCGIRDLAASMKYYWRVNATNAGGTGSFSGPWSFSTSYLTGIRDQSSDENIRIYPVPADDILHIDGIDKDYSTVSILTHDGKLIKQIKGREIHEIDISELKRGVYLVKTSNSRTVVTKKIVIL